MRSKMNTKTDVYDDGDEQRESAQAPQDSAWQVELSPDKRQSDHQTKDDDPEHHNELTI